ncbi:hypothetical protein SEA_ATUIN_8 [Arthrobacter phage Atuin]|nr:hypothetical protein SEA_ATUIN_107 [Arthrobacter phage Atuin]
MNAKVTTWWKRGGDPVVKTMPESMVQKYLANLPQDLLKGYIVDAAPSEENRPRAPIADDAVTTIFPVEISGKIHAAFVMDYRTDKFATMCGKQVKNSADVLHKVTVVTCNRCADAVR